MKKSIIGLCSFMMMAPCFAVGDDIWESLRKTNEAVSVLQNQVNALITLTNRHEQKFSNHMLGELYHGGIIFYVDETGQHGLIASVLDLNQGEGLQWRNGASGNKVINAKGDGIGAGEANTRLIIAQQTIDHQQGQFAALMATNYRVLADGITPCPKPPIPTNQLCYGSWYLPSAYELSLLRQNLHLAGLASFSPAFYWSSTETNVKTAWMQNMATGEFEARDKASTQGQVRAVSRF